MRIVLLCLLAALGVGQAATLTGIVAFNTASTGASGGQGWNTLGNPPGSSELLWNLYLTQQGSGLNGAFINTGGAAATSINIDLSVPGTYTFYYLAETVLSPQSFYGMNLFFNGDNSNPGISVFAPANGGAFSANGAATRTLSGLPVSGANSLVFADGPNTITLTAFSWHIGNTNGLTQVNRVQAFNSVPSPDGRLDDRGFITLEVVGPASGVPEPSTFALFAAGGLAAIPVLRRRTQRKAANG